MVERVGWGFGGGVYFFCSCFGGSGALGFSGWGVDGVCVCACWVGSLLGYDFGAEEPAGFWASTSISKNGFPTSRLSPSPTWNFDMTPALGLLISTVTLSV